MKLHHNSTLRMATVVLAVATFAGLIGAQITHARTQAQALRTVDFNADGKTDVALFDATTAQWHTYDFYSGQTDQTEFGPEGGRQVVGDYDGDGFSDYAVSYDDSKSGNKIWLINFSSLSTKAEFHWGTSGDIPVPADYDGDGITDFAVFRPSDSNWYLFLSNSASLRIENFGLVSDKLVPADYDGDGLADIAVMRSGERTWYIRYSMSGADVAITWNVDSSDDDVMVPADYDGDGRDDVAMYDVGTGYWTILETLSGNYRTAQFGAGVYTGDETQSEPTADNLDIPMPGDFDGDGIIDMAVWSWKTRIVNVLPSQSSGMSSFPVGNETSWPISLSIVLQNSQSQLLAR